MVAQAAGVVPVEASGVSVNQSPREQPKVQLSRKAQFSFISLAFFLLSAVWTLSPWLLRFKVLACDVGQGDAIILRYGPSLILIDAGPNEAVLSCLRQETSWFNRTIDVAIVTHWDADHIGGFSHVLGEYKVEEWLYNPSVPTTKMAQQLQQQIGTRGILPSAGDVLSFPGLRLKILWSERTRGDSLERTDEDRNRDSIALVAQTESFGFFSAADLECSQQLAIYYSHLLNKAEMIKVAHHGAKSGTCPSIFSAWRPEVAVISAGRANTYGHPHEETLEQLRQNGVFLWRTDVNGPFQLIWNPFLFTEFCKKNVHLEGNGDHSPNTLCPDPFSSSKNDHYLLQVPATKSE